MGRCAEYGVTRNPSLSHQASFACSFHLIKIFARQLHCTAHPDAARPPTILSDEIDVRPLSKSATGVKPRNAVIGRPLSLTTRRDDQPLGEEKSGRSCLHNVGSR